MSDSDLLTRYGAFLANLGIDLVAILFMSYVLYFRRHYRSDLLLSYIALNLGIFTVMSVLAVVRVDIAVGFGLFAILSIVRLRSSAVTQQEVAYYFITLVLGLVNGINVPDRPLLIALNVLLVAVMVIFDGRRLRSRARRLEVTLEHVYTTDAALVAELERRLGGKVVTLEVEKVDLVHHHVTLDVRLRPDPHGASPSPEELAVKAKRTHAHPPATDGAAPPEPAPGNGRPEQPHPHPHPHPQPEYGRHDFQPPRAD